MTYTRETMQKSAKLKQFARVTDFVKQGQLRFQSLTCPM